MKKAKNVFIKNLRYFCLTGVIALGLMTIVGCNGDKSGGEATTTTTTTEPTTTTTTTTTTTEPTTTTTTTTLPPAPSVPTNVSATAGDEEVTISWDSVSGATSYNIYWSTSPGVSRANYEGKIEDITEASYTHTGLTNGTTCYYVVTAENSYGESDESDEVNATPLSSDTTPPTVSSTSPVNNATDVAVNTAITATFSEAMDSSTINTATFLVNDGTSNITGTVTYSGTAATFTPSADLKYDTTYTATVTTGTTDTAGNAIEEAYEWSFSTEAEPVEQSDFTPAAGMASDGGGLFGPWNTRLRVATSDDGMTWTEEDITITDQGDVPCGIIVDGKLWVFYVIWRDADETIYNTTVAAYTTDLETWVFRKLSFTGLPIGFTSNPVDPTVVEIAGGYRMYFTLGPLAGGDPYTHSATSNDLINWEYEGERFEVDGQVVLDPNLLWVGDHYEFFAGAPGDKNHHATSADGLTFTELDQLEIRTDPENYYVMLCNGMQVGDDYKYYGFAGSTVESEYETDIRSLTYDGGTGDWSLDDGVRLELDAGSAEDDIFVKDPALSVHPDGASSGYVMVYVTVIPED